MDDQTPKFYSKEIVDENIVTLQRNRHEPGNITNRNSSSCVSTSHGWTTEIGVSDKAWRSSLSVTSPTTAGYVCHKLVTSTTTVVVF